MSERDDKTDLQTKIRLINPLAYTHSAPPFGNCDRCGKAGAPYVGFDCSATTATPKCWLLRSESHHEPPGGPKGVSTTPGRCPLNPHKRRKNGHFLIALRCMSRLLARSGAPRCRLYAADSLQLLD